MKKIISVVLAFTVLSTFMLPCYTVYASNNDGELYTYTFSSGKIVRYYLDDDGNPYSYVNGEIQYMLLPLEKFKITDRERVKELNSQIANDIQDGISAYSNVPSSWYDMSGTVSATKSVTYTTFVNFDLMSKVVTPPLKVHSVFANLNIVTANMEKKLFSGKKVTIMIEFYVKDWDSWYSVTYEEDFTGEGHNYSFSPSETPYIRMTVSKSSSGVKNFDLEVLTWGV